MPIPIDIRQDDPFLETLKMPTLPEGFVVPPNPNIIDNSIADMLPNDETGSDSLLDEPYQSEPLRTPGYGIEMPSYNPLLN